MSKQRMSILVVLAVFLAVAGFAASTASASHIVSTIINTVTNNSPTPTCTINGAVAKDWHWDPAQNKCVQNAPVSGQTCTTTNDNVVVCIATPVATIGGKEVSSNDVANGSITILQDSTVKAAMSVKVNSKNCQFFSTFKNSGEDASGHVFFFIDHNGTLCRSKASPTGWIKYSGGMTGRKCFNEAAPMNSPFKVVHGIIMLFKNFAHVTVPLHAEAQAHVGLPNSDCYAEAHSSASASISLTAFVKSKGNVDIHVFDQTIVNLSTGAWARANCQTQTVTTTTPGTTNVTTTNVTTTNVTTTTQTTTTTTPPPSHFTNVSCTGFEEIFGGESMIVKCDVSNDNGAPISLDAHSNNDNSRVSGINCYSQGGTPSCQGNGQFEFRVSGVNNGSTVLSSSVTVTATSNGVSKTWNSDPFPVDPHG